MKSSKYSQNFQESNMRISSASAQYLIITRYQRIQPSNIHYKFRLLDNETLISYLEETKQHPEKLRTSISRTLEANLRFEKTFRVLRINIYHKFHSSWIPKLIRVDSSIQIIHLDTSNYNMSVPQLTEIQKSLKKLPFLDELECKFWYEKQNAKYYESFLDFMANRKGIRSTSISVGELEISRKPDSYKFTATAYHDDYQYISSKLAFFRNFDTLDLDIVLRKQGYNKCGRVIYLLENFNVIVSLWKSSSLNMIMVLLATIFKSKRIDHVIFSLTEDPMNKISPEINNYNLNALHALNDEEYLSSLGEYEIKKVDFRIIELAFIGISLLIKRLEFTFDVDYKTLDSLFGFFKFVSLANHLREFVFKFNLEIYDENIISELMKSLKSLDKIDCLYAKFSEPRIRSYNIHDPKYLNKKYEQMTYFSIKKDPFCKFQLYLPLYDNKKFLDTIFKMDLNEYRVCLDLRGKLLEEFSILSDLKDKIKGLDYLLALRLDSNFTLRDSITFSKTQKIDSRLRILDISEYVCTQLLLSYFENISKSGWIVEEIFLESIKLDEDSDKEFFCELIESFKSLDFLEILVMKRKNQYFSELNDCYSCFSKIKRKKLEDFCKSKKFEVRFYPGFTILKKV